MKRKLADGLSIRFAAVGEAPVLADLARRAGDPVEADLIDAYAAAGRVFVGQDVATDEAVAVAVVGELDGVLAVESLCVLEDWRGRGVGTALLTAVEEFARWAFFGQGLITARSRAAVDFLFRRGWLAVDAARMPEDVRRLGAGRPVLTKRF
ncbi:GNAT family N-acetyltransferase [Alsobacter sp. R-9]